MEEQEIVMNKAKITSTFILLFILLSLLACVTAKSQYEEARKVNTLAAYQNFLGKYPSGEYAQLAQNKIEALEFEKAQAVNSVEAYETFMSSSNSELFKNYAIQRIQKIYMDAYLKAKTLDSVEAYAHYISHYPKSEYVPRCVERIENLEWRNALKRHDAVGYYKYLNNCSACGKHNQDAQKRFKGAVKAGKVTDLSAVDSKVHQILKEDNIVVMLTDSKKVTTKTGPVRIEDLASVEEVLVRIVKEKKTINAADLAKGTYASEKTLGLKDPVPISTKNTIGFSTIIFYSEKNEVTEIIFIEDGSGYLFKEAGLDFY